MEGVSAKGSGIITVATANYDGPREYVDAII